MAATIIDVDIQSSHATKTSATAKESYNLNMSKREKRLQKLRKNPNNVSFDDLKQVLEDYYFEHVRTAGSHHTFIARYDEKDWRLTIPFHRPIKQAYVMKSLEAIDEIIALRDEKEPDDDNTHD